MHTLRQLSIAAAVAAALGLASLACAQAPAPSNSADAPAAEQSTPSSHDNVAGIPSIVGMDVKSPVGEVLGNVITVVASTTGRYAIISTGNDTATAVPYEAVAPMVRDGGITMDKTKLQNSPQVAQADLHDHTTTKWRQQADTYWAGQKVDPNESRVKSASPAPEGSQVPKER